MFKSHEGHDYIIQPNQFYQSHFIMAHIGPYVRVQAKATLYTHIFATGKSRFMELKKEKKMYPKKKKKFLKSNYFKEQRFSSSYLLT